MPAQDSSNIGVPVYLTATGTICITSGAAELYSILVHGSATGGFALYPGVSGSATTSNALTGNVYAYATTGVTINPGLLFSMPSAWPRGLTVVVLPSADPRLTLFWRPMGPASS